MLAYKGDKKLKAGILKEMKSHRKADQIIKGTYGKENGVWKGCAVGCAIHSLNLKKKTSWQTDDHSVYETELGIPRALAFLEDSIFENLPQGKAQDFAVDFLEAVQVGSDLTLIVPKFMVWLMDEDDKQMPALPDADEMRALKEAVETIRVLYKRLVDGGTVSDQEWTSASDVIDTKRRAARAARDAWDAWAEKSAEKILSLLKEAK